MVKLQQTEVLTEERFEVRAERLRRGEDVMAFNADQDLQLQLFLGELVADSKDFVQGD